MSLMYPVLFVDLLKQASYKNTKMLSVMHKQLTYFSKKYSKLNRITLDKYESNKLFVVCKKDNIKVMKYVCKCVNMNEYMKFMFRCVELKNNKILMYLINCGNNVRSFKRIDNFYTTLISYTCKIGNVKAFNLLMSAGAMNKNNDSLFVASMYGHIEIVKLLLVRANKYITNYSCPLRVSAGYGHTKIVKLLIKCGAKMCVDYALMYSAKNGHLEIVKLLLGAGANIHAIDMNYVPPNVKEYLSEKLKLI